MSKLHGEIFETESSSPDFKSELATKLADLMPEVISDGKIDGEKLQELLGEDLSEDRERFGLFWPGKRRALKAAQTPTTATLSPMMEESINWESTKNLFLEGDNLEILKILQRHYHGKIKVIYIDPPYNTGNDFIYPDNFKEGLENYLTWSNQVNNEGQKNSTNSESDGRYHSNWLNMMYPRLKLARNLLSDDGVIMISIDDNEFDNLHKIANEIFGESNQVGVFTVIKAEGGGLAKHIIKGHDYVLVYSRSIGNFKPLMKPKDIRGKIVNLDGEDYWVEEDWLRKEFGKYGTCLFEEIEELLGKQKLDEINQGLSEGKYVLLPKGDNHIVGRYRKISEDGSKFYSVLKHLNKNGVKDLQELGDLDKYFDYPKPLSLIKELIQGATLFTKADNEIVLDFFAGSGTTAQAVMELNSEDGGTRKFIAVQLPEPTPTDSEARKAGFKTISEVTRERIKRAGTKIHSSVVDFLPDTGFRSYKLTDTNFSKWEASSDIDVTVLEQHILDLRENASDEASSDSLLSEILLKQGYSLTEEVGTSSLEGLNFKIIGQNIVVAYLDESQKPTLKQLKSALALNPARFIILEDALQGDDELKTNLAQECKAQKIELWTA
jgi:adenine-specific DNA-methyltransferase